jgi:glycosyltransferase involved in cell wall biosynthesis
VGDGPRAGALVRAIHRARLDRVIELCGARTRTEIRALFSNSDLFVLPTVRESFGLAALEARCAGLPVLAMAASGVAEIIHPAREGALARSDREVATHIAALAADPERRRAIAEHNRATPTRFDWPRVVESHVAVYREAIALRDSACRERNA